MALLDRVPLISYMSPGSCCGSSSEPPPPPPSAAAKQKKVIDNKPTVIQPPPTTTAAPPTVPPSPRPPPPVVVAPAAAPAVPPAPSSTLKTECHLLTKPTQQQCEKEPTSYAAPDIPPDVQLWLNTLSRCPSGKVPGISREPVKTVALLSPTPPTNDVEREQEQAVPSNKEEKKEDQEKPAVKSYLQLSTRHSGLKDRLNTLARRLFCFKSRELMKHVVNQLEKFDSRAILSQLDVHQQLPCQFKFEDKAPSHSCRDTDLLDGHAFSSLEKLRMCSGEATLTSASTQLSRFDNDVTDSSSEEDAGEEEEVRSDLPVVCRNELSAIEHKWEHDRSQIAAQWTWIRGQYEDLQHRMRRESDLLTVIREEKEKIVLLPSDQYTKDHDKFAHYPAMVPPLNGYHNHPLMKGKYDIHRVGQEMYLKSNQHKRLNKTSKVDGNTCARTRPLACIVRRNVISLKDGQGRRVSQNIPLRGGVLGKQCTRRETDRKRDSYHAVLSRRSGTHVDAILTPLLSTVDFFPKDRKLPVPECPPTKEKSPTVEIIPPPGPPPPSTPDAAATHHPHHHHPSTTPPAPPPLLPPPSSTHSDAISIPSHSGHHTALHLENTSLATPNLLLPSHTRICTPTIIPDPLLRGVGLTPDQAQKKRCLPAATVEHMFKKYRSSSQPGSRATSPTPDKKKKHDQYNIHNIEVDLSVVAPARIERPQYKEIEIPKFRTVTDTLLRQYQTAEGPVEREDDSHTAYQVLHSRCEQLEKVRFINMQLNASAATRDAGEGGLRSRHDGELLRRHEELLLLDEKLSPLAPSNRTLNLLEQQSNHDQLQPGTQNNNNKGASENGGNNKHVTYVEEEIRRTRGTNKHTSEYPTAVS